MQIIKPKTNLATDLETLDDFIQQSAKIAHDQAEALREAHAWFWNLPTERLLDLLNEDVAVTLATFSLNTSLGTATNASLDAVNHSDLVVRAPVTMGRTDIMFDGTAFIYVPPAAAPVTTDPVTPDP